MRIEDVLIIDESDIINPPLKIYDDDELILGKLKQNVCKIIYKKNIVIYVNSKSEPYLLKNRYGKTSTEIYSDLMKKHEINTKRAIDSEKFIMKISKMNFFRRLFIGWDIKKHLNYTLKTYGI